MALFLCDNFVYLFAKYSPNSLTKVNEVNISVVTLTTEENITYMQIYIIQLKLDPPQEKDH